MSKKGGKKPGQWEGHKTDKFGRIVMEEIEYDNDVRVEDDGAWGRGNPVNEENSDSEEQPRKKNIEVEKDSDDEGADEAKNSFNKSEPTRKDSKSNKRGVLKRMLTLGKKKEDASKPEPSSNTAPPPVHTPSHAPPPQVQTSPHRRQTSNAKAPTEVVPQPPKPPSRLGDVPSAVAVNTFSDTPTPTVTPIKAVIDAAPVRRNSTPVKEIFEDPPPVKKAVDPVVVKSSVSLAANPEVRTTVRMNAMDLFLLNHAVQNPNRTEFIDDSMFNGFTYNVMEEEFPIYDATQSPRGAPPAELPKIVQPPDLAEIIGVTSYGDAFPTVTPVKTEIEKDVSIKVETVAIKEPPLEDLTPLRGNEDGGKPVVHRVVVREPTNQIKPQDNIQEPDDSFEAFVDSLAADSAQPPSSISPVPTQINTPPSVPIAAVASTSAPSSSPPLSPSSASNSAPPASQVQTAPSQQQSTIRPVVRVNPSPIYTSSQNMPGVRSGDGLESVPITMSKIASKTHIWGGNTIPFEDTEPPQTPPVVQQQQPPIKDATSLRVVAVAQSTSPGIRRSIVTSSNVVKPQEQVPNVIKPQEQASASIATPAPPPPANSSSQAQEELLKVIPRPTLTPLPPLSQEIYSLEEFDIIKDHLRYCIQVTVATSKIIRDHAQTLAKQQIEELYLRIVTSARELKVISDGLLDKQIANGNSLDNIYLTSQRFVKRSVEFISVHRTSSNSTDPNFVKVFKMLIECITELVALMKK